MGRITIKDIARLLKVSPSTVSRALKDHPDISQKMRIQVKQVADELGYIPNYQAINFRKQESRLIGVILPDMNMYFFPSVIQAIESEVRKRGYHLIVLHSNERLEREIENVSFCRNFGLDGLLVSLSRETNDLTHFREISEKGIPVVYFDRVLENHPSPQVVIRDEAVAEKAVNHLLERGRQKICGIFGNPNLSISRLRQSGFQKAMKAKGLEMPSNFIIHANDVPQARQSIEKLLEGERPSRCHIRNE